MPPVYWFKYYLVVDKECWGMLVDICNLFILLYVDKLSPTMCKCLYIIYINNKDVIKTFKYFNKTQNLLSISSIIHSRRLGDCTGTRGHALPMKPAQSQWRSAQTLCNVFTYEQMNCGFSCQMSVNSAQWAKTMHSISSLKGTYISIPLMG